MTAAMIKAFEAATGVRGTIPGAGPGRLGALAGALLLCGCSITPWVKPYERERLADPIMTLSRDALADKHREHVYDVREGARGATGVQGGGCGCN